MSPRQSVLDQKNHLLFSARIQGETLLIEEFDERMGFEIPLSRLSEKYIWYKQGNQVESAHLKFKDGRELLFDKKLVLITEVPHDHEGPIVTVALFDLREHIQLILDFVRNREELPEVNTMALVGNLRNAEAVGFKGMRPLLQMLEMAVI